MSLGQGQEIVAEQAMDEAAKKGHWVVLQNIHLVKKWLPLLEKKLEIAAEGSHPDYRVFMSAEPASSAAGHIIPQVSPRKTPQKLLKRFIIHFAGNLGIFDKNYQRTTDRDAG